jgi:hypothetical protein
MKRINIMVSEHQLKIYKKAAKNHDSIAQWARTAFEDALRPASRIPLVLAIAKPKKAERRVPRARKITRAHPLTISVQDSMLKDIHKAARDSNLKASLFCMLILDHECGISNLVTYLSKYY